VSKKCRNVPAAKNDMLKQEGTESMENHLSAKRMASDEVLIGYLDLCGTKAVYRTLNLEEQLDRTFVAVSSAWTEQSLFNAVSIE
jgi:hypothetical protein